MPIKKYFQGFIDLLFPKRCFYCRKIGNVICDSCLKKIKSPYLFERVENDSFDYLFCSDFYQGNIKTQMHQFKFYEKAYLYEYFISIALRDARVFDFLKKFDVITYVPMHRKKEQQRGYNQAELLAQELGKRLNIVVIPLLEKKKENKKQSTLSEEERWKNVEKVYKLAENVSVKNKNIILVDDILTTGATTRKCSQILKENQAGEICVFAIAKTTKFEKR